MSLYARILTKEDYDNTLVKWWSDWGWSAPSREFLPNDGEGGIIIYDDEDPVCAGFMYVTNSKAAWVDWIISSKTYNKKPQRKEALSMLIETLTTACQNMGFKYVYALIKHPSLINVYKEVGYIDGDTYTKEMIIKF